MSNEKVMIIHLIVGLIKKDIAIQRWVILHLTAIVKTK